MINEDPNELAFLWIQRAKSDLNLCKIALHTTEVLLQKTKQKKHTNLLLLS
jgi:hypothetical protein